MLSWFIAAALILIFELFVGTIYLLVVSAALFGAGLAELLFGQTTISVLTAAVLAAVGIWWAKGWIRRHRRAPEIEAARDDVHQATFRHDIDVDLRVEAEERQHEPREDFARGGRKGIDA